MTTIPKSASKIGIVEANGNRTELACDTNRNTGEPRLYVTSGTLGRTLRLTGRNLEQWLIDINDMLNEGELHWVNKRNDAALSGLAKAAGRPDLLS